MAEIDPHKFLATTVGDFALEIAVGIARAQTALDQAAFALWKSVDTDPQLKDLKEIGYQPTWYTIPIAEAEIKLTFYYESQQSSSSSAIRRAYVLPYNAKTQTASKLQQEGASQLKLKIVPSPPPVGLTQRTTE